MNAHAAYKHKNVCSTVGVLIAKSSFRRNILEEGRGPDREGNWLENWHHDQPLYLKREHETEVFPICLPIISLSLFVHKLTARLKAIIYSISDPWIIFVTTSLLAKSRGLSPDT